MFYLSLKCHFYVCCVSFPITARISCCQIMLQDSGVFEMLNLTQELGVEELRAACEDHVTTTLSVLNACTFLAAAMDIQDRAVGKYYT